MNENYHNRGVVLLMAVFVVALVSALVIGMLQLNTEDIRIVRNHINAAEALAVAEAGLNDALAQLRANPDWKAGFTNKAFSGGTYTVTVTRPRSRPPIPGVPDLPDLPFGSEGDLRITSVATSAAGYTANVIAQITISEAGPPHVVAIDSLEVNG